MDTDINSSICSEYCKCIYNRVNLHQPPMYPSKHATTPSKMFKRCGIIRCRRKDVWSLPAALWSAVHGQCKQSFESRVQGAFALRRRDAPLPGQYDRKSMLNAFEYFASNFQILFQLWNYFNLFLHANASSAFKRKLCFDDRFSCQTYTRVKYIFFDHSTPVVKLSLDWYLTLAFDILTSYKKCCLIGIFFFAKSQWNHW